MGSAPDHRVGDNGAAVLWVGRNATDLVGWREAGVDREAEHTLD